MELIGIMVRPDEQVLCDPAPDRKPQLTLEFAKLDAFEPEVLLNVLVDRTDRRPALVVVFHAADNVAQELDVAPKVDHIWVSCIPVAFAQKRDFRFFVVRRFLRRARKSFRVALAFNEVLNL